MRSPPPSFPGSAPRSLGYWWRASPSGVAGGSGGQVIPGARRLGPLLQRAARAAALAVVAAAFIIGMTASVIADKREARAAAR